MDPRDRKKKPRSLLTASCTNLRVCKKKMGYKPDMIMQAVREGNTPLEFGASHEVPPARPSPATRRYIQWRFALHVQQQEERRQHRTRREGHGDESSRRSVSKYF
ncbi:uncharacterized protein BYT42DRAFT_614946 [Radiomyces spectabilis]|uniref:uncharacterized protein n=1 Tax=Radiomyces spectabilis TaxID=64574 RepID=UPI00221FF997|nr:uncharacterized protein BYT42DRAFT_614946 [Radiomyces spectabilis]KAI8376167.1 hypothetical protein BYT42DRAFT_614946 [Radiomyces spectabilis]